MYLDVAKEERKKEGSGSALHKLRNAEKKRRRKSLFGGEGRGRRRRKWGRRVQKRGRSLEAGMDAPSPPHFASRRPSARVDRQSAT